jgi:hypothetical protein
MAQPFDFSVLPENEIQKVSEVWGEWLGSIGGKLVNRGDQFKTGAKVVASDGVHDADNLLSGYSVIEAENIDEALAFANGSPILENGGTVEVYEAFGNGQ